MEKEILMKCGHIANAEKNGKPSCAICNCDEIKKNDMDLTNRKAVCSECGKIVPSKSTLPFFQYCPSKDYDNFYCGCWGWE